MNIRNVETFLRVVELNSFTHAAESLNYVQSTVTMQIRQLEQELGFPLFDRIGRSIALTSYGEEFLGCANRFMQTMLECRAIGSNPTQASGIFRIGTATSLFPGVLQYALPLYKKRFPNIELRLKLDGHNASMAHLNENSVDMLYRSGPLNMDPNFVCHYKRREQLVFVANPEHPLAKKTSVHLEEVFSYEFIATEVDGICNGMLEELARSRGLTIRNYLELANLSCLAQLLQQSNCVSFLPENYAIHAINEGTLRFINAEDMEPQQYYSQILFHKDKWIAPYMQGLVDIIREIKPERE